MSSMREGDKAWVGLAAYVVAYDAWAMVTGRETLSSAFARAVAHPKARWVTIAAWATLTGHLFQLIPQKWDPLRRMALAGVKVHDIRGV